MPEMIIKFLEFYNQSDYTLLNHIRKSEEMILFISK